MATPQYEILRNSIRDDDCLKAFEFLLKHIGYENRASIEDVAFSVFRSRGDSAVRKARDVVELLRTEYGLAVCSTSGKAGRWLASSDEEKRECLADFYARRRSIDEVIKALERAIVPPPHIPSQRSAPVQTSLF
jgi:hypothetical protein